MEDPQPQAAIQITRDLMAAVANDMYDVIAAEKLTQSEHNLYEVTKPGRLRVYGDIDTYAKGLIKADTLDKAIQNTLRKIFKTVYKEKYCLMTATGLDHKNKHKGAVKVSWRFVLPNLYGTQRQVKLLVMHQIEPMFKKMLYEDWGIDLDADQELCDRAVYSKNQKMRMVNSSKPNENRPLILVKGSLRDTFITYIPEGCVAMPAIEDEEIEREEDPVVLSATLTDKEWSDCQILANLIPLKYLDEYSDWCRFVWCYWGLEQSQRVLELIDQVSKKSSKYGGIQPIIRLVKDFKKASITLGTIKFWCKGLYENLLSKGTFCSELFACEPPFNNAIKYEDKYVKPLIEHLENHRTIILKSHLGTGKTVAIMGSKDKDIKGVLSLYLDKRVLFVSARKSFTAFALNECINQGIPMQSYEGLDELSKRPLLFVQVESLWKLESGFQPYDLVVLDESESILKQLNSADTHKENLIANHVMLERIVASASRCILMDAFISNRSLEFANTLRSFWPLYIENTFQPYKREAIELINGSVKDKRVPAQGAFVDRILTAIKDKKRIVIIWGSRKTGLEFEKEHLQGIAYQYYHSGSTPEVRETLSNVNESWKDLKVLMYTSTITVGISYTGPEFDEAFLWGCAGAAGPRDIAQALLRVRSLKANKLTYTSELRGPSNTTLGLEAISEEVLQKKKRNAQDHPLLSWQSAPVWVEQNYIYNKNEERVSQAEYKVVLRQYLEASGYTIKKEVIGGEFEVLKPIDPVPFDDIRVINSQEADKIKWEMKRDESNPEDIMAYNKYKFMLQLTGDYKEIWEQYFLELQSQRHFWNLIREKHESLADYAKGESKRAYSQMTSSTLEQRTILEKVLNILGLEHSQDDKSVKIDKAIVDKLKPLEGTIRKALGIRESRGSLKEFGAKQGAALIQSIWTTWCGVKPENIGKEERIGDNKKSQTYVLAFEPLGLWGKIVEKDDGFKVMSEKPSQCIIVDE